MGSRALAVVLGLLMLPGTVPLGLVALSQPASAGPADRYQEAHLTFAPVGPTRATGVYLGIDYTNPDDPDAKPPAVRKVVEILPRGSRIDTSAPARCRASDLELMAQGAAACPARSVVGTGFIKIDTGIEGPARYLREDVTFLNNNHELIYLNTDRTTGLRVVTRAEVTRRRVISTVPPLPGSPPDGAAIDRVRAEFPKLVRRVDGERRVYVRTPGECPDSGYWVTRLRFTYDDGTQQTERTRVGCD